MPIADFVSFEIGNSIETLARLRSVPTVWPGTVITMLRMVTVVYIATETFRTMKPRADANEGAASEPLPAVVAVRSALVRRGAVVPVWTLRRDSEFDAYLSLCFGNGCREADSSNSR